MSWSPDGVFIYTVDHNAPEGAQNPEASTDFSLVAVPVAGGDPVALTHSTDNAIFAVSFFPRDDRILYSSDQAGNEISHLYRRDEDGTVTDLTPAPEARTVVPACGRGITRARKK